MHRFERLFDEMIEQQKAKMAEVAGEIIPNLTSDDLLQPNDFPALESHPYFRYEEGLLAGLQAARIAFLAQNMEISQEKNLVF